MILKCARKENGSYRIFDNVHNLKYEYRSAKNVSSELIMEYSSPDTTTLVWEDENIPRAGNVMVLEFKSGDKRIVILSQFSVYLMNDEGKTIEHLRY